MLRVPDDVLAHNTQSIPAGTQAIGQATFEEGSKRIQVHFNTLVYPDGDQHGLQGVAMMGDGSAGLIGDYHSEGVRRELGNFFGNFISGFAAGMTDRTASGGMGIPYDVGSVKNGVLNGVAICTQDSSFNPVIVSDGTGGAIIAWESYRGSTTTDIFAQCVNSSGAVQ